MTRRAARALLPFAAVLIGTATPGTAAAQRAPEPQQGSRGPDWLLLGVAGIAFVVGRAVIPRIYRRNGKTPR
ncbi:hypothetical protein [Sphingobium nicotianae]|uniref:Uncharacterized protein n=1 Tax=Sphingobium nicotianae TaxID=2782607 RepID=A0A9X1DB56_9SPHN|nr:hypothetical protein [Sphingobium nicotianae]MBT2186528.1 hypothetical protein [Sphingobium nicotianae]